MRYLIIVLLVAFHFSCAIRSPLPDINVQVEEKKESNFFKLKNEISKKLAHCAPNNWTVVEHLSEENKTHLAHIGKGIFDLHFKSNYKLVDTLFNINVNGKNGHKYYPEIILHFYRNEERTKEAVKFTQENPTIISDMKFARSFGETSEFLIYECSLEIQRFQPRDQKIIKLRKCLLDKAN